ncbi:hypothetical protein [Streptomyces sp. NPDC057694]|uniref:hypothetical protein n=1 Tax=Streptomyces sp. NPDC057694 TaxID=3346216 RepID=UPI0036C7C837
MKVLRCPRPRDALVPLLVPVVYVLLQLTVGTAPTVWPDTTRYARAAEQHLGAGRADAYAAALAPFCADRAERAAREAALRPRPPEPVSFRAAREAACLREHGRAGDVTTLDPRYQSVFESRWAYPWTLVPFAAGFGLADGLRAHGLVTAAGCALLAFGLLRAAGLGRRAACAGQVALLATPLGWWSLQPLTEGLVLASVLAALWGAVGLVRGRAGRLPYGLLLAGALAGCFLVRYSTALPLCAALTAAPAAHGAARVRTGRPAAGSWWAAGIAAAGLCLTAGAVSLLALPTSEVTLQDTFTVHFTSAPVPDPWSRLWDLNSAFWHQWWADQAAQPTYLALTATAAWSLHRRSPALGLLTCAVALVGFAQIAAHPLAGESDRLGVLMWLPAALGLPFLPAALRGPRPVPVPHHRMEQRAAHAPGARGTARPAPTGPRPTDNPDRPRRRVTSPPSPAERPAAEQTPGPGPTREQPRRQTPSATPPAT